MDCEGQGDTPWPQVCRKDKCPVTDGHLVPANSQFTALNKDSKYAILSAIVTCPTAERACGILYD